MLKTLRTIFRIFSRTEKLFVLVSAVARLLLVGLDIIGVGLLGVSVAVAAGTTTSSTSLTGVLLKSLEPLGAPNLYALIATISVGFFCTKSVLALLLNRALGRYLAKVEARHSADILRDITKNNLELLDKWSPIQVAHGLLQSSLMAFSSSISSASIIFGEIALISGISIFLAVTDLLLFLAMGLYFLLFGLAMHFSLSVQTQKRARELDESWLRSQSIVDGVISNFRQYATAGTAGAATEAFRRERAKVANAGASLNLIGMLPRYITEIALVIGLGLLVAQRSLNGSASPAPAVLAIFIAGAFRIVASMLPLQASFNSLKQIGEVSKTAISLSRETSIEPEAQPKAKLPEIESSPPSVELQAVSYSFNRGKPILKNISLTIRGGEFVAILGKSGAGKSTLADLILGLRTPHEGRIRIGDQPAREYIDCHPGAVGYVPQKIDLISGTLAQNVTLDSSTTEYDQLAMARAIDLAQLSGVVDQLGEGLGTRIEQGLQIFSGGQLQRIALARALYWNPRLIVLDEATSALDDETEDAIREVIESLKGRVTLLVIAHRTATIMKADRRLNVAGGAALFEAAQEGNPQ